MGQVTPQQRSADSDEGARTWRKSSWSLANGNCVEVGRLAGDLYAVPVRQAPRALAPRPGPLIGVGTPLLRRDLPHRSSPSSHDLTASIGERTIEHKQGRSPHPTGSCATVYPVLTQDGIGARLRWGFRRVKDQRTV